MASKHFIPEHFRPRHFTPAHSRREFLMRSCGGLGALAVSSMLQGARQVDPLAPKKPDHTPTAKSVIWLFMEGGPSHLDIFDPKPELERLAGQPMPASFGKVTTAMGTASNTLMPSSRKWKQYGESGMCVSDWYQNIAEHVDDMTMLRSCWADGLNHVGSVCQMNTGSILAGRPSMGAWLTYGLGTANNNLPTFVILTDAAEVVGGSKNWSSGFLPASFQGTLMRREGAPILDLAPPDTIGGEQQRGWLDCSRSTAFRRGTAGRHGTRSPPQVQSRLLHAIRGARSGRPHLESEAARNLY
jgi:hypothetical protein